MDIKEFKAKYNESLYTTAEDVLRRIESNLADLEIEKTFFTPEEMDNKLRALRDYARDYRMVIREQAK